ncbi:Odorant receptor 1 [Ephemera danica]|nr:Odorant receptor 1 [Ephemera danica]
MFSSYRMSSLSSYSQLYLKVLRVSGVWPWKTQHEPWQRILAHAYTTYAALAVTGSFLGTSLVFVMMHLSEWQAVLGDLWLKVSLASISLKLVLFLMHRKEINTLLNSSPKFISTSVPSHLNNYKTEAIQRSALQIALMIIIAIVAYFYFQADIFIVDIAHLLKPTKNTQGNTLYILGTLLLLAVERCALVILMLFHLGAFGFYLTYLRFIEGYLDHLKDSIIKISVEPKLQKDTLFTNYNASTTDQEVRYCVSLHQFIIGLVDRGNAAFSTQMLFKLWRSLVVLCLTAKELTNENQPFGNKLTITLIFLANIFELFNVCWLADVIQSKMRHAAVRDDMVTAQNGSEGFDEDDNWITMQAMSYRCQMPLDLRAGPYYHLSIHTFSAILGLSFTYFIFLTSVKT